MRPVARRSKPIPRWVLRPCPRCGHRRRELNGRFFRNLRLLAKVTLAELAPVCGGVSIELLSRMERGEMRFLPKYAEPYLRLFERRRRAGEPS